jgi:endoglucanase
MNHFGHRQFLSAVLMLTLLTGTVSAQYLRVSGTKIVDGEGKEVILRGMGLGGWMLQEPYMLEMSGIAGTQHEIRSKIVSLVGETNTQEFYNAWLANHCTRRDVDSLASWGFNSIRLPMHYNLFTPPLESEPVPGQITWIEKGFTMVDSLLDWCRDNHMYLILDLHAAPGGQGHDAAISDYDATKPSLWESAANRQKTIALWKKIAERYANEEWIGAYDLINEPNWNFTPGQNANGCSETSNAPLRQLYVDITSAIRSVDNNHIIIIEGNCWGNNYAGMFPKWDNNLAASFHKYWNYNDIGSIQGMLNMRNSETIPLWMGESGENSNNWFTNAISLIESNKIGWSWWPLKKINSVVNPLTVMESPGYIDLLKYLRNGGTKPSVPDAMNVLMQLTENLKIENNIERKDVVDAMFRQVHSATTLPFNRNQVPGTFAITDYDLGRCNKAYFDTDTADYHVSTNTSVAWNSGYQYRNDGVDIERTADPDTASNGFGVTRTVGGEWLAFTLLTDTTMEYTLTLRYATQSTISRIRAQVNGLDATGSIILPKTDGEQLWNNIDLGNIVLYSGTSTLKLMIEKGGMNLGSFMLTRHKKMADVPFEVRGATTLTDSQVLLSLNKKVSPDALPSPTDFNILVNESEIQPVSIQTDTANGQALVLLFDRQFNDADTLLLSYHGTSCVSDDSSVLQTADSILVRNTLPVHVPIPAKIQAEAFTFNAGLVLENCSDLDGGQDAGYTNTGDYLEYRIRVPVDSVYQVQVREACLSNAGIIELQQRTDQGTILNRVTINMPVTGGWQTWQTVVSNMRLTAGSGILRIVIIRPEFNINWFSFLFGSVSGVTATERPDALKVYPNPANNLLQLEMPETIRQKWNCITIYAPGGQAVMNLKRIGTDRQNFSSIDVSSLPAGMYILRIDAAGEILPAKFSITR